MTEPEVVALTESSESEHDWNANIGVVKGLLRTVPALLVCRHCLERGREKNLGEMGRVR
jgi:hypothetical protein